MHQSDKQPARSKRSPARAVCRSWPSSSWPGQPGAAEATTVGARLKTTVPVVPRSATSASTSLLAGGRYLGGMRREMALLGD